MSREKYPVFDIFLIFFDLPIRMYRYMSHIFHISHSLGILSDNEGDGRSDYR